MLIQQLNKTYLETEETEKTEDTEKVAANYWSPAITCSTALTSLLKEREF